MKSNLCKASLKLEELEQYSERFDIDKFNLELDRSIN